MERVDKHQNKDFYDTQRADDRRRFEEEPSKLFTAELLVPWVVSRLQPGDAVLDIAGGSGSYASQIVRAADVSVVGVDISESMIRQRGEDPMLPHNVVGDMEALPFQPGTFDGAMFVACLHHVPDPLPALREAWRVLRPGGQVFALEPCSLRAGRGGSRPLADHPHEFRMSRSHLADRMGVAGFRVNEAFGRQVTMRVFDRVARAPSLRLYRLANEIDRILFLVPGAQKLGWYGMLRATKVG